MVSAPWPPRVDAGHSQCDHASCDRNRDQMASNVWHGHQTSPPLHLQKTRRSKVAISSLVTMAVTSPAPSALASWQDSCT